MAIYRGPGGAGDATADASNAAAIADGFADAANASAGQAAASAASALAAKVAAELAETNAELAETNAETAEAAAVAILTDAGFIVVAADLQGTDTIGTVATNIANVNATGNNIANVTTVAGSIANVNTNATNIANINQNAANIVAIQNASANATTATTQAGIATTQAANASASAAAASAVALGNEPVRHSVRPSLLLDFANTKTLDPRITFTRASTASFYDGKTVAKAEENLLLNSEDIASGWSKTQCVATANTTVAPNGTTTGDTFTANAFTGAIYVQYSLTPVGATTVSIFAKAGTHPYIQILNASDAQAFANFDLTAGAGVVGTKGTKTTSSIVDAGNGWYRCVATFDATTTFGASNRIYFAPSASATYAQAITAAGTETIILWGAQVEQRSSVTAYTPTTTAPITNYIPALQTAASGVARFEHNPVTGESLGLEIEEQRTNLFTYSDDFSNAIWTKTAITVESNTAVSPSGTLTGDKLIPSDGTNTAFQAISVTSGISYSLSIYAKMAGHQYVVIRNTFAGVSGDNVSFDLSGGVVQRNVSGVTSTITSVGNGWYRCFCSWSAGATGSSNYQVKTTNTSVSSSSSTLSGTFDGYSGIYIWGAQLEAGAFATSYIPTVASQVTRSSDAASMTGTNFSSWYRADEGTLYAEAFSDSARAIVGLGQGSFNTNIVFNQVNLVRYAAASPSLTLGTAVNGSVKLAAALKPADFAASANGAAVVTSTANVTLQFIANQLQIGAPTGSGVLNGTIKKLAYYPRRLTNAELVSLSTV